MSTNDVSQDRDETTPETPTPHDEAAEMDDLGDLDDLDDLDFDLDEVENKIAPLALADLDRPAW
ncbi:hypothetical protein GCM10010517_72470 [Streptosporangium fragile]|uniref:Ammosamide/lymphostin RiPP family protein n=1 Tax=Streptosporangium fragile TaxID=46186 RepID=A0ABP6IRB1_9ACTN